jgi:hypothetical protein
VPLPQAAKGAAKGGPEYLLGSIPDRLLDLTPLLDCDPIRDCDAVRAARVGLVFHGSISATAILLFLAASGAMEAFLLSAVICEYRNPNRCLASRIGLR